MNACQFTEQNPFTCRVKRKGVCALNLHNGLLNKIIKKLGIEK